MKSTVIQLSFFIISFVVSSQGIAKESAHAWQSLFPDVPSISQAELEKRATDFVLLDVRAKFLFDREHKEGIKHISFSSRMFMLQMEDLIEKNKGKTIVVYCDSDNCIKSYRAVEKCHKENLKNVVIYDRKEELAKLKSRSVYSQLNVF